MRAAFKPNELAVYDEDDNEIGRAFVPQHLAPMAIRLATKRKSLVFVYGDNGHKAYEPDPTVGCPATLCYYTDRHAGTVIAVSASGRKITIREDRAVRTDDNGMSECQSYRYEPDDEGRIHVCYRQRDGRYKSNQGPAVVLGRKRAYHDYGF